MPPIRIPVKPRPPVPPGSAVWPPKPQPPDPGPITPPGPRGDPPPKVDPPETVFPGGQPTPPNPEPPMPPRQPGMYSDAFVALNQTGGSITADIAIRGRWTEHHEITFAEIGAGDGANLRAFVNNILRPFYDPGNATRVRPWMSSPPGSAVQKSASKETLLEQTALTIEEKLDILAAAIETIGRDIAELKSAVLASPPPAEMPKDHWGLALNETEEPVGLDQPLTSFDAVRAAEYAVWRRSPLNGAKVGSEEQHARALALVRAIYHASTVDEIADPLARRYYEVATKAGASIDVILWAPLVGMVDLWPTGFAHIDWSAVTALAGVYKQDGFHPLTWEDAFNKLFPRQGGTPSGHEG